MSIKAGFNSKVANALAIASQAVVYSNSFRMSFGESFGASFLATSASSVPDLKIELEQGDNPPTTEGSSDSNYVVADGVAPLYANLTVETTKRRAISPVPSAYGRYKITGGASNPSDTVIDIINFQQEMI